MLRRPAVAGVRQINPTSRPVAVVTAMEKLGHNTGNMMFTEAVNKVLENSRSISFQLSEEELSDRDSIVFPAANWINPHGDFGEIANRVSKTNLPVIAIGIGAQSTLNKEIPKIKDGTLRFLKIISERSKEISTRGVFSCEVLEHYGIKNSVPTGCPSLLLTGRDGVQYNKSASLDRVTLHGTRHGFHAADAVQSLFYHEAFKRRCDILLQSETADMIIAGSDTSSPEQTARAHRFVQEAYSAETELVAVNYLQKHGKYFTDYASWVRYLETRTLCVGSRIHGTIAGIISGTPSLLIAHDSRTLELAQTMGIPHVSSEGLLKEESLDMGNLVDILNEQIFYSKHDNYIRGFDAFFSGNGLSVAY